MKKLGIIGAMTVEVETLKENMTNLTVQERAGMIFYQGELEHLPVVVVVCGVGKVNAALCVQVLCDCFGVDCCGFQLNDFLRNFIRIIKY